MNSIMAIIIGIPILIALIFLSIMESKRQEKLKEEAEERKRRIEHKRLTLIAKLRPSWGDEICDLVTARKVEIGMSKEMVLCAWGKPHEVDNIEVTERFEKERWVYGKPRVNARYITFKDNKVTAMKQTGQR